MDTKKQMQQVIDLANAWFAYADKVREEHLRGDSYWVLVTETSRNFDLTCDHSTVCEVSDYFNSGRHKVTFTLECLEKLSESIKKSYTDLERLEQEYRELKQTSENYHEEMKQKEITKLKQRLSQLEGS